MRKAITISFFMLSALIVKAQQKPDELSNLSELKQYLDTKTEANQFSGVVLIARNGIPIFEEAFGLANKSFEVKNNIHTKFNIGSLSKQITSIAILQLAEKGLINLNYPIGKYLDSFPDNIADKVTVLQLLNMKSGWGDPCFYGTSLNTHERNINSIWRQ